LRAAILAATLFLLLPLAACDDDDAGKVVSGDGYELTVPDGWSDESDAGADFEVSGFRPELVLVGDREDGFATNVNIIRGATPDIGLDEQFRAEREQLQRDVGSAHDLTGVERLTLGGREARAHGFEFAQEGRTLRARQVFVRDAGATLIITLTALPERFDAELGAFTAVLESWRWR
jgi:hypothetical protein